MIALRRWSASMRTCRGSATALAGACAASARAATPSAATSVSTAPLLRAASSLPPAVRWLLSPCPPRCGRVGGVRMSWAMGDDEREPTSERRIEATPGTTTCRPPTFMVVSWAQP